MAGIGMSSVFEAAPLLEAGGFSSIVNVDQRPCGLGELGRQAIRH